jgi:thiamine biosynthesis lipoprotein
MATAVAMSAAPFAFPRLARRGLAGGEAFVERWSWAMGQPVHLMLFAESEERGEEAAAAVLAELRRVEQQLSLFDSSSDLVELNLRAGRNWLAVGEDIRIVLAAVERIRVSTDGAFNAAIEPLMVAWGFHRPRQNEPTAAELAEATEALRATRLAFDGNRVRLEPLGAALDLGGIGVGHGLDRGLAVLRQHGVRRAFLDISGDCAALDPPPGADGWTVDIADPLRPGAILDSVSLRRSALATSANTQSVLHYGAMVRGHVIDPDTGYPTVKRRQATVIASTGMATDALSTASLVAGRALSGSTRTILA